MKKQKEIDDVSCEIGKMLREIELLKRIVLAQERMLTAYRCGKLKCAEWVHDTIAEARDRGII